MQDFGVSTQIICKYYNYFFKYTKTIVYIFTLDPISVLEMKIWI